MQVDEDTEMASTGQRFRRVIKLAREGWKKVQNFLDRKRLVVERGFGRVLVKEGQREGRQRGRNGGYRVVAGSMDEDSEVDVAISICIIYLKYLETYLETLDSHFKPNCHFKMFKNSAQQDVFSNKREMS
jgi:mRNA-degrading endonuclease RelE of RelBE toxin-antitoxin system